MEKNLKNNICIHIYIIYIYMYKQLLCCIPETNIGNHLYFNLKKQISL